jgi:hypothetical protein
MDMRLAPATSVHVSRALRGPGASLAPGDRPPPEADDGRSSSLACGSSASVTVGQCTGPAMNLSVRGRDYRYQYGKRAEPLGDRVDLARDLAVLLPGLAVRLPEPRDRLDRRRVHLVEGGPGDLHPMDYVGAVVDAVRADVRVEVGQREVLADALAPASWTAVSTISWTWFAAR